MRIREILFQDFRCFRGRRRISFVDPLTDTVRDMTVIAGTNGSGKTTILDAIEALLGFALREDRAGTILEEANTGLVCASVELPTDLDAQPSLMELPLHLAVGRRDLAPRNRTDEWSNLVCRLIQRGVQGRPYVRRAPIVNNLRKHVSLMLQGKSDLEGGVLYYPHTRRLGTNPGGSVEPPPEERTWIFRFLPQDEWRGSLEQLWVWHNYLDLEGGKNDRRNLKGFVESVENILGEDRRITVEKGRAMVQTPYGTRVRLDQLPSGEQQVLLLFGELARRLRPGAVIMIDEPELSLHSTLQHFIVVQLRKFARKWKCQVILATHSLDILRAVHESEVIFLDKLAASDPEGIG